jgi:acyl-CoA synthetase (AMP-forming)/AMP-acid ligase II/acyl carrier protein
MSVDNLGLTRVAPSGESVDLTTIGKRLRYFAELQPDHVAIVSSDFAPLSYRELRKQIDNVRAALRSRGLGRNARIAIAIPNGPKAALAIVAVSCSAVSIPLNPRQTLREIQVCFSALQPDAVLLVKGEDSIARRVAERAGMKILEVARPQGGSLDVRIVAPQSDTIIAGDEPDDEPDPDAPAFILQTSGTTAEPKLIPTSHRNMLAAAARVQAWFHLTPIDRCLSVSPVFYAHGLHVTVFAPLLSGGSIALPTDASSFDYAEWFGGLRPTWYSAAPTLHRLVFDQTKSRADIKAQCSLRFILSGGAPLPRDLLEGLQHTLGVPVVEHYGSSEGLQICANQLPPGRSKSGTCGVPAPDTIAIVADDGRRLPHGQQGEILVGGPTVVSGYLGAPELNRASFVDGWFKSGDIGSIDEDGFLKLHDRKNDLINRGGEKISPMEIDEVLTQHPAIAEAAAFSIPHSRLGEDLAAAVVLRPGMTATTVELRKYLQEQLAPFKVPGRIDIRDQLPKGKTGKILRRQLGGSLEEKAVAETLIAAPPAIETTPVDNTLIIQLTELWERLLQIKRISLDDDFSEKGGDSLLAMAMLSEVEQLTGQTIPSSILFEARTIRQLAQELFQLDIQSKSLIKMNTRGGLTPLFLFHGDYHGGGLYAVKLASALGPDQPLFVVAPHDLGREPIPLSIEAMAADRLPLILNAQPKGPYRLSGYCIGGLIAFEVARLLVAAGEKVEMVSIIDAPTVGARRSVQLILSAMRSARPIAGPIVDRAAIRTWYILSQLDRPLNSLKTWLGNIFRWRFNERFPSIVAMSGYSPKPVAAPVLYFAAAYGSVAWRRLSSRFEMIKIGDDRAEMGRDPHAEVVRDPANIAMIAYHLKAWMPARKQVF